MAGTRSSFSRFGALAADDDHAAHPPPPHPRHDNDDLDLDNDNDNDNDAASLAALPPPITDDAIVALLGDRFRHDLIYTSLAAPPSSSSLAIVAVNPFKFTQRNSDAALVDYAVDYRDTSRTRRIDLPPHIFKLASDAYFYMRRTGQDQAVLFTGESGSGKSEMRRLAIKSLVDLSVSAPGKKGAKLTVQIPSADFILESFGNASTVDNPNASRFGKYTELQFNDRGRLAGAKTLDYYLERTRVVQRPAGERNFHVFYYLVAGASPDERAHLRIHDRPASAFRYLAGSRSAPGEDAAKFGTLKQAFKNVGLSKRHVAHACQTLAAILHLGQLEFYQDGHRTTETASVSNPDVLDLVADFLGVPSNALRDALTYKTKLIRAEVCTVLLDADGASAHRDDLAKTLYSLLFAWLNETINQKLCRDDFANYVALFDLPGPQNLGRAGANGLDQFCVNFANECLHRWTLRHIFERNRDDFDAEGLPAFAGPDVPFFDNAECLRLLTHQPGGLIHIMDDQARRAPKKTDRTMIDAFSKRWANHASFKVGPADRSGLPTFVVSHFSGAVTYSPEGFLERNSEAVSPDFVSLFRGDDDGGVGKTPAAAAAAAAASAGSSNSFIRGLFASDAIATQVHPRNEATIVAAQQSVKPMRAPSMRRPAAEAAGAGPGGLGRSGTLRRTGTRKNAASAAPATAAEADDDSDDEGATAVEGGGGGAKKGGSNNKYAGMRCVAGEFRSALDTLFETLDETKPWFVFCLRPNDSSHPHQFEPRVVKAQVRSLCLPEMVTKLASGESGVRAAEYAVSMTHEEFCERYADTDCLGHAVPAMAAARGGEAKQKVYDARELMSWGDEEAVVGRFKVFLTHAAFRELEDDLRANDAEEIKRNQAKAAVEAEMAAGVSPRDPFSPYAGKDDYPAGAPAYDDPFSSSAALPLVGGGRRPFDDAGLDDNKTEYSADWTHSRSQSHLGFGESASVYGSELYAPSRNMFADVNNARGGGGGGRGDGAAVAAGLDEKIVPAGGAAPLLPSEEVAAEVRESSTRKKWKALVWIFTFWLPGPLLSSIGRIKRPDVRMAWREKLTINMLIWLLCAAAVFVIAVLGNLICPKEYVFSQSEFQSYINPAKAYTAIRGEVFDLTNLLNSHRAAVNVVPDKAILAYAGVDATKLFPVQVSALCAGVDGQVSPWVQMDAGNVTDPNAQYHDFRSFHTDDARPDWYYEQMIYMRSNYRTGFLGFTPTAVAQKVSKGSAVAIYRGGVYDVSQYIAQGNQGVLMAPPGMRAPPNSNLKFMDDTVISLFTQNPGKDVTTKFDKLNLPADVLERQRVCLRNLYFIGKVDSRNSPQCLFSRYILLALSIVMVAIIGFKFLAALQFGRVRAPEDHDKFVLCQVPCYTEGEESMRKTIDSLAALKYDDKRKLLVIICDGMIVGSGNDRPTPRIVLDILGVDPNLDPEPLSFLSLGEGAKQHNMGKVYAGLYEHAGHVVPYIVIVKCGKPSERQRPGNRGKRDSQMVLMRFLNKVHFGLPMSPLELEMYHQIKNVIGVNPSFYEYILQVDADTETEPLSLNKLVSAFTRDKKVIGLCGETSLSNAKKSFITMLQVYEYYISHYLAKAFESLFGSVTCLPGCFSMFRLRTPDTHKPLFIANRVIEDYAENRVDTLHMKNLLHLGEDRYLTTIILKHFPNYKTIFVRDAKAKTAAPDEWRVLLSQRRRWINSTIHNLVELVWTPGLCGFCLFSMRFIVFIDLLSTLIAPVTVAYIVYLIYLIAATSQQVPVTSLIMLAAIYGLQAIIFILNRKWEMIGWMVIYIIGIPIWSFFLPLYSFWHMDDFSWGNTRLVQGENGKKLIVHDEGKFDPSVIPLKSWDEYEAELWERGDVQSLRSFAPGAGPLGASGGAHKGSPGASIYGGASVYGGPFTSGSVRMGAPSPSPSGYFDTAMPRSPMPVPHSRQPSAYTLGSFHHSGTGTQTPLGQFNFPPQANFYSGASAYGGSQGDLAAEQQSLYGFGGAGQYQYQQLQQQQQQQLQHRSSFAPLQLSNITSSPASAPLVDVGTPGAGTASASPSPGLPPDEGIVADLRQLIAQADLSTITKKALREMLENKYGAPIAPKKAFINSTIDSLLQDQL